MLMYYNAGISCSVTQYNVDNNEYNNSVNINIRLLSITWSGDARNLGHYWRHLNIIILEDISKMGQDSFFWEWDRRCGAMMEPFIYGIYADMWSHVMMEPPPSPPTR